MDDYTLFPIRKADMDWMLYHLVRRFLARKYALPISRSEADYSGFNFQCFDDDARQSDDSKYSLYLVFPSEDPTVSYSEAMLGQETLILKCFFPVEQFEQTYPGQIEPLDDDEVWYENVPMEYFCFPNDGSDRVLQHCKTSMPSQFPDPSYNGDALSGEIDKITALLRDGNLTATPWYGRLQTTKLMLDGEANELHILHNAGLYDHKTLWNWLKDCGIGDDVIERVKGSYLKQLKKYAMFVLNRLDWMYGTPVEKNERRERKALFADKDADAETQTEHKKQSDDQPKTADKPEPVRNKAQSRTEKPEKLTKRDKIAVIYFSLFAITAFVTILVIGVFVDSEYLVLRTLLAVAGGVLFLIVSRKVSERIVFRHPPRFRYLLVAVGIISLIVFGWSGNRLALALAETTSSGVLMLEVLVVMAVVVAAAALMRRKEAAERRARPYTLAILIAMMAVVGFFFGGFIMNL